MRFLKSIFRRTSSNDSLKEILQQSHLVIDVRTKSEFEKGHFIGSKNIPLQEFENRLEEILAFKEPIIICCRSGARSEKAISILQEKQKVYNGGSWKNVQALSNH